MNDKTCSQVSLVNDTDGFIIKMGKKYVVLLCIHLPSNLPDCDKNQDQLKHFHPKTEQSTETSGTLLVCDSCDFTVGSVLSDDGHSLASVLQCCCRLFMCGHAQVHSVHLTHTRKHTNIDR